MVYTISLAMSQGTCIRVVDVHIVLCSGGRGLGAFNCRVHGIKAKSCCLLEKEEVELTLQHIIVPHKVTCTFP